MDPSARTPLRQLSTELTFIKTQSSLAPSFAHAEARRALSRDRREILLGTNVRSFVFSSSSARRRVRVTRKYQQTDPLKRPIKGAIAKINVETRDRDNRDLGDEWETSRGRYLKRVTPISSSDSVLVSNFRKDTRR